MVGSTYTDLLRLEKQATGENSGTWGTRLNTKTTEMLEDGIAGYAEVAFTSSDVTLSTSNGATDEARVAVLKATGTLTANVNMIVPASTKKYVVWNATTGDFSFTVKTSGGTGVVIQQNGVANLFCDGTNVETVETETNKLYVPAAAMSSLTTSGAAGAVVQLTAGNPELIVYNFDSTADEAVQFSVIMPDNWDLGTITFKAHWTSSATDTDGVAWGMSAVAISDGDTIDASYGTPVVVTDDAQGTANDLYITAESSAITVAGTPAKGDMVYFKVIRDVSDANDDMAEDARLIGVTFTYGVNAGGIQ
jgi:hypothetical protein